MKVKSFRPLEIQDLQTRFNAEMDWMLESYNDGCNEALLDAVSHCLNTGLPAPKWVVHGFNQAWEIKYYMASARTLDEAFGISRPKNWRKNRARKNVLGGMIWQLVIEHMRKNPGPINKALFEEVADTWNQNCAKGARGGLKICATEVQEAYYAVSKNK